jgi:hypothetical protein
MHLVYPTSIYKWDIHDLYSYTRPVRAIHNLYESALALCVLFYFLRLLYICSSPYSTRDTHYRLINILLLGYYYVSHIRITWLYQHFFLVNIKYIILLTLKAANKLQLIYNTKAIIAN